MWHVLLDSFDEALERVQDLVELLDQWLRGWTETEREQLRLRIATRPGALENAALEEMLENYWRSDQVSVRDIAPLTRDDVLRAATVRGVPEPDGFAASLEQRGLVPVASLPIPLTTLLDRAAEGHPLPATAAEVSRLACEQLCEEANRTRQRPEGLGLQEVMGAAAHLAAVLEFCGNGVLTESLLTSPGGPVRLVDVAATAEAVTGGQAQRALNWLTTTPLLRSLSGGQWQFALVRQIISRMRTLRPGHEMEFQSMEHEFGIDQARARTVTQPGGHAPARAPLERLLTSTLSAAGPRR